MKPNALTPATVPTRRAFSETDGRIRSHRRRLRRLRGRHRLFHLLAPVRRQIPRALLQHGHRRGQHGERRRRHGRRRPYRRGVELRRIHHHEGPGVGADLRLLPRSERQVPLVARRVHAGHRRRVPPGHGGHREHDDAAQHEGPRAGRHVGRKEALRRGPADAGARIRPPHARPHFRSLRGKRPLPHGRQPRRHRGDRRDDRHLRRHRLRGHRSGTGFSRRRASAPRSSTCTA